MSSWPGMLDRALKREGSISAVARRLQISRSRISDALKRRGRPLGVDACLRFAVEYGEEAGDVLRANGKHTVADLLDALGIGRRPAARSSVRRKLDRRLDHLSEPDLELLDTLRLREF